jgi:hypothetical protein
MVRYRRRADQLDLVVMSAVLIVELSKSAVFQGSNDSTEDARRRRISTGRSGIFCRVILGERPKQYMTYSTQAVYHEPAID